MYFLIIYLFLYNSLTYQHVDYLLVTIFTQLRRSDSQIDTLPSMMEKIDYDYLLLFINMIVFI